MIDLNLIMANYKMRKCSSIMEISTLIPMSNTKDNKSITKNLRFH